MAGVGCALPCLPLLPPYLNILTVGAMFYLSPTLTMLMLAVVPPVSLGAVRLYMT